MSRSLKISEEVYEMLWCIKPFSSMSFNDVILMLIEGEIPVLPIKIRKIRKLNETDPDSANSELDSLKNQIFQDYIVDLLLRIKELREEALGEEYYEEQLAEREKREL